MLQHLHLNFHFPFAQLNLQFVPHRADRVPAGTHRGDGDHTRSRASLTMEDISHASWDDAEEKDKP